MNIFDKVYGQLILEFSEKAIQNIIKKFQNEASEDEIRREVADFEKFKNALQKKDPFQYKSWIEFTEAIHAAKGKADFKKKKAPEKEITANQEDVIADDENVTIYKGDSQDKCVMYGQGYSFCISRQAGGNMFSNYRLGKESTFYFIYFKKKPKNENDHIMVLDHTNTGYEWTFADNHTQRVGGGWNEIEGEYPELRPYEKLLTNKKLDEGEREFTHKLSIFSTNPRLEDFNEFSYDEKVKALKSVVDIPDEIWATLDSTLRNEFLSIGPNLTLHQADELKPNEIKRYKKTRILSIIPLYEDDMFEFNQHDNSNNELLLKIASSYDASLKYFENRYLNNHTIKNLNALPIEIVQKIATNPQQSFLLLSRDNRIYYWDRVGDVIIDGISKSPKWCKEALDLFNHYKINEPPPMKLIKGLLGDIQTAVFYVLARITNEVDTNPVIIDFFKDIHHAKILMSYLNKWALPRIKEFDKNLYNILVNYITNSYEDSLDYAQKTEWKNLPKPIYDVLARETKIPSNATIEERYKKLSTFDRLFEEAMEKNHLHYRVQ